MVNTIIKTVELQVEIKKLSIEYVSKDEELIAYELKTFLKNEIKKFVNWYKKYNFIY